MTKPSASSDPHTAEKGRRRSPRLASLALSKSSNLSNLPNDDVRTVRKVVPLHETSFGNTTIQSRRSEKPSSTSSTSTRMNSGSGREWHDGGDGFDETLRTSPRKTINSKIIPNEESHVGADGFDETLTDSPRSSTISRPTPTAPATLTTKSVRCNPPTPNASTSNRHAGQLATHGNTSHRARSSVSKSTSREPPIPRPKLVEKWIANKKLDIAARVKIRDSLLEQLAQKEAKLALAKKQQELCSGIMERKSEAEKALPEVIKEAEFEIDQRYTGRVLDDETKRKVYTEKRSAKAALLYDIEQSKLTEQSRKLRDFGKESLEPIVEMLLNMHFDSDWKADHKKTVLRVVEDRGEAMGLVQSVIRASIERDPYVSVEGYFPVMVFQLHAAGILRFDPNDPKRVRLATAPG